MTSRQRILIVTPLFPPQSWAGTQLRAYKLVQWLRAHGFQVEVICVHQIKPGPADKLVKIKSEPYDGVMVHRLYLEHTNSLTAFRYLYDHPDIRQYLEEYLAKTQPNLIHMISGYLITGSVIEVAHKQHIPTVVTLTDYWFICPRTNLIRSDESICGGPYSALDCTRCLLSESRRYRLPEKILSPVADIFWKLVDHLGKEHIPLYHEVVKRQQLLVKQLNSADVVTIPTQSLRTRLVKAGVHDRFVLSRHGIVHEQLGITADFIKSPSNIFRFGFMGQVIHNKGVDLLANAYQRLTTSHKNTSLTIWGKADLNAPYVRNINKQLESIPTASLMGSYTPNQVGEILQEIDALVVTSRWPEIGPFVILEAFATKTPVIAANIGNMPELVQHDNNGLLFEPDSADSLYRQMSRFLTEPSLYEQLRANIPSVRTQEDEMAEVLAIYQKLISAPVS